MLRSTYTIPSLTLKTYTYVKGELKQKKNSNLCVSILNILASRYYLKFLTFRGILIKKNLNFKWYLKMLTY